MVYKFLKVFYDVIYMFFCINFLIVNLFLKGMLMVYCRMIEIVKGLNFFMGNVFKVM